MDLDDRDAAEALSVVEGLLRWRPPAERQAWADAHAQLLLDIEAWRRDQRQRWVIAPRHVIAGLHALRRELWATEVERLLAAVDGGQDGDRRLPHIAQELAAGRLVDGWRINDLTRAVDWDAEEVRARSGYEHRRREAASNELWRVPWYRRRRVSRDDLAATWDAQHLVQCLGCLVARLRQHGVDCCPICRGELAACGEAPTVAPLAQSLLTLRPV
jgi:hypothetical protein